MVQTIAVVPLKERHVYTASAEGGKEFKNFSLCAQWLGAQQNGQSPTIISIMGGPGESFLTGLGDRGFPVQRIPISQLQKAVGLESKASPDEKARVLQVAWESRPDLFYPMRALDPNIALARQYARQRLNLQEQRKTATLRIHSALRDFAQVLPPEAAKLVELLDKSLKDLFKDSALQKQIKREFQRIRKLVGLTSEQKARILSIRLYQSPESVLGPKQEEKYLEGAIVDLLGNTAIWEALHRKDWSLPRCMGMGPALAGAIISEIGDIRRFPSPGKLRAYAKFHLVDGKFPHRRAGEVDSGNQKLERAVWILSTDQFERYDHPWRNLYRVRKAHEMQMHPEPVARIVKVKSGGTRTVYDFTLKHLDSRTARWVGSQFLEYLWGLWTALEEGRDLEAWYAVSGWPARFAQAERDLLAAQDYLKVEIPRRRRSQPKEEEEEEQTEE